MKPPKIVFFDLETLPDPQVIYSKIPSIGAWPGRTLKAELQSILSFGYKIYGDKKASCINTWNLDKNWNKHRNDDSILVHYIYEMLKDADEIVTHNGKSFDLKIINTRLAYYGFPPIPKIHHVDTKIVAKRHLSLYSNSLSEVAKFFKVKNKMTFLNKWDLWTRIAFGNYSKKDLKLMNDYCKQDVEVLEQIYLKLRPFHDNYSVNKNLFKERGCCPTCGSHKLIKHGTRKTRTKVYERLLCTNCGSSCQITKKGIIS